MTQKAIHEENSRTVLTVYENAGAPSKKFPQILAAIIATLSACAMGMCLAWTSAAIPLLQKAESRIQISPAEGSWIGSLITLGAFSGAFSAGVIVFKIGPKRTLQLMAFPLFASWVIIAYCSTVYGLCTARFLAGIAIGAISVSAPTYIAELAEAKIRGSLGTFFQLQITLGLMFQYVLGGLVEDFTMLALIPTLIPVVYLILMSFMPESPVYLTAKGYTNEARISLQWFRGEDCDIEDEISRIRDNIKASSADESKISDLYTCKATARAMVIALGLMIFQQLSGINAVIFYAGNIFVDAGTSLSPNMCAIVVGIVQVVATYISTLLIDVAGRRILLLISTSVMSICLIGLGSYFHLKTIFDVSDFSFIPLVSVGIYMVVFSIGLGPIPWLLLGELFNSHVKGRAVSICAAFNWILAFTITKTFQTFIDNLGSGLTFGLFGLICLIGTIFVTFVLPETKGKHIDEIIVILGGGEKSKQGQDVRVYVDDETVSLNAEKV